jgi:hypothetical protein
MYYSELPLAKVRQMTDTQKAWAVFQSVRLKLSSYAGTVSWAPSGIGEGDDNIPNQDDTLDAGK